MKKYLSTLLAACLMLTATCLPATAYEYTFEGKDGGPFSAPTSDHTIYAAVNDNTNIDRSKTAAVIPPRFGSPTSYTLNAGEYLTPNLIEQNRQYDTGAITSTGVTVMPPSMLPATDDPFTVTSASVSGYYGAASYTEVTSDLYYSGGQLGTLSIPAIGLTVKVYQGTDNATLAKGAGHFTETSAWDGNIAIAGHNRGVNNHFGKIHTLNVGDKISYTTKLGTRSYEVFAVSKIAVDDGTVLNGSAENIITLITCVMNQPQYRWCVQAKAAV